MELVPGATLKEILAAGPLPFEEVLRLGSQMIEGLAAAHAAHIVHCDIKPTNIKVTTEGELKILDFGLARLMPMGTASEASTTSNASFIPVGTIPYMPPEQLRGCRRGALRDGDRESAVCAEDDGGGHRGYPAPGADAAVGAERERSPRVRSDRGQSDGQGPTEAVL
jgi:serine/threonine protein kinase